MKTSPVRRWDQPEPMEVAAALVVLDAARLHLGHREVRLLNTAQASGVGWEQIASILDLGVEDAEERYWQLKPRLDEPVAEVLPPSKDHYDDHRDDDIQRHAIDQVHRL